MKNFKQQLIQRLAQKNLRKKNKDGGFTLVELLIVVVILGILSGVALPNFIKQRDKAKVGAANSATAALMTACEIAITSDIDVTLDEDVTRLADTLPDDAAAVVTATITSPDVCSATITGTAVATDGSFEAFGAKTGAIAGEPAA